MPALITFESDNEIYLKVKEQAIQAFETTQQALSYFETGYSKSHGMGYTQSMSACINHMTFTPAIHEWNHEDAAKLVEMNVLNDSDLEKVYTISNVSGRMTGIKLTGDKAKKFHESGITPRLI